MKVQVRYFASVKEQLGPEQWLNLADLGAAAPRTVGQLCDWLSQQSPRHAQALSSEMRLRAALNQVVCTPDAELAANAAGVCEVAFFPPVTGG